MTDQTTPIWTPEPGQIPAHIPAPPGDAVAEMEALATMYEARADGVASVAGPDAAGMWRAAAYGARHRAAELRAAVPDSGEPPTLTLPDGWEQDDHIHWQQALYVSADGIELDSADLQPDDARSLAARLVEAAGIVEQLRAGAR